MLSQFQTSYQRVEQSLQRLTDSIAAYNPSTSAAEELLAADEGVNANVEQLVIHQNNHIRIQELRQTAESLEETLKNTIRTLADTRREILAIPAVSTSEEPRREVKVDELLAYARFISKTTVPPTFRKQDVPLPPLIKAEPQQTPKDIATPASATQDAENNPYKRTENVGTKAMDADSQAFINPRDLPFEPWPSHDVIQRSALADIQRMIESGQDPGSVLTAEEQAEADRRKKEEEERERLAQEEAERRRMSMFDTGAAMRRRPTAGDVFNPDDL